MKFSSLLKPLLPAAAVLLMAVPAQAGPTVDIRGTEAIINFNLNEDNVDLPLLDGTHPSGVKITSLDSKWDHRTLRLPVKGGALDVATGAGQLQLGGGIAYTRTIPGRVFKVVFSDLLIDITSVVAGEDTTFTVNVSALISVDGQVRERAVVYTLPDLAGTAEGGDASAIARKLPLKAAYLKANFEAGELRFAPGMSATYLDAALGLPAGTWFPEGTLGRMTIRTAFKPQ